MAVQFFYDSQIRRFLLQFTRLISNFQVQFSTLDATTGRKTLQTVPVFYGDGSRQASVILNNNSENTLQAVPAMAFYISALQYDRTRLQDPTFVGKLQIRERKADPTTGMLTHEQGDSFTVERPMPVPYMLTLKLDIWTSNTEQKLQILEQIATLFNPSLEIQSTDNYVDWTSLSAVTLNDTQWSSRTIPVGTEDPIDVATMTFELPIWISPPAKVTKMGVIQKIINSIYDSNGVLEKDIFDPDKLISRRSLSLLGYGVLLMGNRLKLVKVNDGVIEEDLNGVEITNSADTWRSIINEYGHLTNGSSQVRLETDDGHEIIGTVAYDPTNDNQLLFNVLQDTLPVNTLPPVTAVIDPFKNNVIDLLFNLDGTYKVATNTRYLILNDINSLDNVEFSKAWSPGGNHLVAHTGDIIQYDGTTWRVSFDAAGTKSVQYVSNLNTSVQLRWTGKTWVKSYEGLYRESTWRLVL